MPLPSPPPFFDPASSNAEDYANVRIENFSSSFNDGLALLAILHKALPGVFDYNYCAYLGNAHDNLETAFSTASDVLNIPKVRACLKRGRVVVCQPSRVAQGAWYGGYKQSFASAPHGRRWSRWSGAIVANRQRVPHLPPLPLVGD